MAAIFTMYPYRPELRRHWALLHQMALQQPGWSTGKLTA